MAATSPTYPDPTTAIWQTSSLRLLLKYPHNESVRLRIVELRRLQAVAGPCSTAIRFGPVSSRLMTNDLRKARSLPTASRCKPNCWGRAQSRRHDLIGGAPHCQETQVSHRRDYGARYRLRVLQGHHAAPPVSGNGHYRDSHRLIESVSRQRKRQ